MSNQVAFCKKISTSNAEKLPTLTYEQVDKYDFKQHFIEFIKKPEYVHLYFDFDDFENESELNDALKWCNGLKKVFGEYSYGGYTTIDTIADNHGIALIEDGHHTISIHVIFYETMIRANELVEIMKWDKRNGYSYSVPQKADYNVYKLLSGQKFRHVLSDKFYGPGDEKNAQIAGFIHNDLPPSTQLVQIKGDERLVEKDEWIKVIKPTQLRKSIKKTQTIKKVEPVEKDELDELIEAAESGITNGDLITITTDELVEMLNEFEPRYATSVETKINCVFNAPQVLNEVVEEAVYEWYGQIEHDNGTKPIDEWFKRYRKPIENNCWLFTLIKHMDDEKKREMFKNKYMIKINDAKIVINDDKIQHVGIKQLLELKTFDERINLLKTAVKYSFAQRCFVSRFGHEYCELLKEEDLRKDLKTVFKGKMLTQAIEDVYSSIIEDKLTFDMMFVGWKHESQIKSGNYEQNIKDFESFILTNTFNNGKEVFEYYLKRISFMLHHPGVLSKVCFIFKGLEGTGKNTFTDLIAELFNGYSNPNAELSKISSRFNISSYLKVYVVCNEALDNKDNYQQTEYIKKVIERPTMDYEKKGIDSFTAENLMNLDITSNNSKPVVISPTDRRFAVVETNNEHANDRKYWKIWYDEVIKREGFYEDVFYYIFNNFYDENFLSLQIPDTEARIKLMKLCLNPLHKAIIDNMELLVEGASKREITIQLFNNQTMKYSAETFWDKIEKYLTTTYDKHKKTTRYYINDNIADVFDRFIDENENDEEEEEEEINENELVGKWIDEHKNTTDSFEYVLMSDINKEKELKQQIIDMLKGDEWEYKTTISYNLKKRGYKKLIEK